MTSPFLAQRTALVTGAAQGIGLAIATRLAAAGARIVLHDLPGSPPAAQALAALRDAGAPDAVFIGADLRASGHVDALMDAALRWHDGIDILVNNAGIQATGPLVDMPPQRWDDIVAVNLSAAFHTMRRALPGMLARGYGRVVNIASVHGLVASREKAPYVAAKFGLVGLTRVAALECASAGTRASGGITANCIAPGPFLTDANRRWIGERPEFQAEVAASIPMGRWGHPREIGALAVYLASEASSFMTGSTLVLDGGKLLW